VHLYCISKLSAGTSDGGQHMSSVAFSQSIDTPLVSLFRSGAARPAQPGRHGRAKPVYRRGDMCSERGRARPFSGVVGNPDTPNRLEPQLCWCACMARMAADNAHRSSERSVGVMCRMSAAEREELKHLAHAAGCSVQTSIMRAVFGRTEVQDLARGRPIGVGDNRAPSLGQHPVKRLVGRPGRLTTTTCSDCS
jgi:hypothetical protein